MGRRRARSMRARRISPWHRKPDRSPALADGSDTLPGRLLPARLMTAAAARYVQVTAGVQQRFPGRSEREARCPDRERSPLRAATGPPLELLRRRLPDVAL